MAESRATLERGERHYVGIQPLLLQWIGECYFSLVGLDKWSEKTSSPFD